MDINPIDVFILALGLVLLAQPFLFVIRPSARRLLVLLFTIVVFFAVATFVLPHGHGLLLSVAFFYSAATFCLLSFSLQHNVRLFHANVLGFNIGYDELSIPLVLWQWSEEFSFVNLLGIPLWRPLSYIRLLRTYYRWMSSDEFVHATTETGDLSPGKSHVAVSSCKFRKLIRIDSKKKYGDCLMLFSPPEQQDSSILVFARSDLLQIKPQARQEGKYKVSYIDRVGFAPKLDSRRSYDLYGEFIEFHHGNEKRPTIFLWAIRKHSPLASPNNLFVHWAASMLFLSLAVALGLLSRILS